MSKRKTKEKFIEDAKKVHGDKYDYSLVDYVNNKRKVKIICPEHGVFEQIPNDHLRGIGCSKCGYERNAKNQASTTKEFIKKARKVHGDKYDYSLVDYVNSKRKVKIICPEHGVFEQAPSNHLQGQGCQKCAAEANAETQAYTTEEFIEKVKKIHGNKYDYSLVDYKNCTSKIKIICPKHGVFEQTPQAHWDGQGCPRCGIETRAKNQASTTEEFIEKARKVHGDKYDYSLVNYVTNKRKIKIICPEHGVFEQIPNDHLRGIGCSKCGNERSAKDRMLGVEEFIKRARSIHSEEFINQAKSFQNNKYDYSLVDYVNFDTKVKIICPKHGVFEQTPYNHLRTSGCPKCAIEANAEAQTYTTEEFIERAKKAHGDKYDYSLVDYKSSTSKVKIICPKHGIFEQIPQSHWRGQGCPECGKEALTYTTEEYIKKAKKVHGDKYDYSLTDYIGTKEKVKIICPEHGVFIQKAGRHLEGSGCPKCIVSSNGESKVRAYLDRKHCDYQEQKYICYSNEPRKFGYADFYLNKIGFIEFDGSQHFTIVNYYGGLENYKKRIFKDSQKTSYCEEHGIPLLRIRYDQIGEIEEMVDDFIKAPEKYIKNHNTFLTNKEYYSIRESINQAKSESP